MKVSQIFFSLQGEGKYNGFPTVFIRLQGCNLAKPCGYCDTYYAQNPARGETLTPGEIVSEVSEWFEIRPRQGHKPMVCITGGEPLFQVKELEVLVRLLKEEIGCAITIETNGSILPPSWYEEVTSWCADVKCPSSGAAEGNLFEWITMRRKDQIKFVVQTREDLEYVVETIRTYYLGRGGPTILISPVFSCNTTANKAWLQELWKFCMYNGFRLSIQQHKLVFDGDKRGV